ncbi:hypothetical protein QWZ16_15300 [Vibrio ostreicida]|uniref:Uncharacterized protein n=1 Tax=Vibrio ostreicida TaxID=526588 RepID=A0ABT8BV73_9VIBR|nr:hypothetical protein [Vibrio ostreicida]MDN3611040.1 hypothetical protein [Vibrio ostreicida]
MTDLHVSNNAPAITTHSDSIGHDVSGSEAMDAIAQLNELMVKLSEIFQKLRNVLQEYNQKQQLLAGTYRKHQWIPSVMR